jgi:hypothetical protein
MYKLHKNTLIHGSTDYNRDGELMGRYCYKWTGTMVVRECTHNGLTVQIRKTKENSPEALTFVSVGNVAIQYTGHYFGDKQLDDFVAQLPNIIETKRKIFDDTIAETLYNYEYKKNEELELKKATEEYKKNRK